MKTTIFFLALALATSARLLPATPATPPASATSAPPPAAAAAGFALRSPVVADGGALPREFTGDGAAATPPFEWSGAPEATRSFALIMHHVDPEGKAKWYWLLYNLPPNARSLPKNVKGVGSLGSNSVNSRTQYAPPHSKGPGAKTYIYTLYALSAPVALNVPSSEVTRDVLLAAMKDRLLASAELRVVYSRSEELARQGAAVGQPDRH
jgi:phosphatidylethanolamine-binding protein (PEBP) family uncharacterized protein